MTDDDASPPPVRPLRLAMTSYYLPSESKIGAGYQHHRIAQAMADRGHDVTMFSPCARPDDARYRHQAVPLDGSLRTFRWGDRIRRLDLSGFDLLHATGDNHLRLRGRPPIVRTLSGSCFSEARHITGTKERLRMVALGLTEIAGTLSAQRAVAISRNSTTFTPWVRDVIPCGVDTDRFRPGTADDVPTILFVGTYERRKRGRLLMEAFARHVRPAIPEARLWMVCTDAPAAPGVEVLGRLSDAELAERYRRATVFCLPSSYEGFGVPYIEAMASGTPVVATHNPGALEVLDHGRLGRVVADDDLGPALVALLRDAPTRAELSRRALAEVDRYRWRSVAAAYEAVYVDVLGDRL